jgi:DNA topoisomerase-2
MSETENLTCLDERGKLIIFKNITELISYFVKFRLTFYSKRKEYQLSELAKQHLTLSNKARFIKDIIDGKLTVNNAPKKSIIIYLEANKFDKVDGSYNYLLNMPIYSLTKERFDELLKQEADKKAEKKIIEGTDPKDMYLSDLEILKKAIK